MPTIDQLENVIVASDDDMLPVSQNGTARRVSRSQLLAGTQTTLSVMPGLIGRVSPGLGPPQQITIGSGLSLADGVLSGAPHYSTAALPASTGAGLTDLVPIGQNGQDNAISVNALLSIGGVDVSNQVGKAGVGSPRRIGDWLGDTVAVEAFGARGDGVTDDTGAINLAIASGRPVLLGPRTYRVDGQWSIQASATLIGTVGVTVLRRASQRGGAWINVVGPKFTSIGIIFDAGGLTGDSWAVLVGPSCTQTIIRSCSFLNATGPTLGTGLTIQARDGLTGQGGTHSIANCTFQNNACHGIWVQAASNATVSNCQASYNGGFGICLDFNDAKFQQVVRQSTVTQSKCWNNTRGISVGNYNATNTEPPRWGLANPDAMDITVSGNICSSNTAYGIAVSGTRIQVTDNQVLIEDGSASASGILCNASLTTVMGNTIVGPGGFGIDSGGSSDTSITSNVVLSCAIGINPGGSTRIRVADNKLLSNKRAVTLFQVETDGHGTNFGIACSDIWIEENLIQLDAGTGGIFLLDGPERVEITGNRFLTSTPDSLQYLCWANTDSVSLRQNTLNGSSTAPAIPQTNGSVTQITVPDIVDYALIPFSTTRVDTILGVHQSAIAGQVSFVRVTSGGSGYTQAKVIITGSGAGAMAAAYVRDGLVIGIVLSSGGSGYDPVTTSATIIGDGQGASLQPFVGLPLPQDRRLSLRCPSPVHFVQGSSGGIQSNWTKTDITVAAGSEITLLAVDGVWQAISFANIDYLQPGGDGSVSLRSSKGDIRLSAGAGGGVRFLSDGEQLGFLTYFGRGSPEGAVAAPPGSDYRNLNGGAGTTLWVKRAGASISGWFPVA